MNLGQMPSVGTAVVGLGFSDKPGSQRIQFLRELRERRGDLRFREGVEVVAGRVLVVEWGHLVNCLQADLWWGTGL